MKSTTMKSTMFLSSFAAIALLAGCGGGESGGGTDTPTIATVNYPLTYFAERLAGDFATIVFEAPADEDPAFWEPGDAEIAKFQEADVILLNGATYAKWATNATLPESAMIDTSSGFKDRLIKVEDAITHAHGDGEEHSHGGTAFTTWMDLNQAQAQATAAAEALQKTFPDHAEGIARNLEALRADLAGIDEAMKAATVKLQGAPVIASHPVYHYWERAYGLKVPSLMWEPEMELGDEALADLRKVIAENPGAKFFVWEGDPLAELVEKVEGEGLTCLVVSPCGNRPETGDFLSVMRDNIAAIDKAAP